MANEYVVNEIAALSLSPGVADVQVFGIAALSLSPSGADIYVPGLALQSLAPNAASVQIHEQAALVLRSLAIYSATPPPVVPPPVTQVRRFTFVTG